jgi:protease-4
LAQREETASGGVRVGSRRGRWWRRGLLFAVVSVAAWSWFLVDRGPRIEPNTIVIIDLRREVPVGPANDVLESLRSPTLDVSALREVVVGAARDPRVAGLVVRCSQAPAGLGRVQEIRAILGEFRKANKPVVAFAEGPDTLGYLVASAATEIYLDESAPVYLMGLRLSTLFLGSALEDLGVEVDLVRVGEYKGGYEQLTASEPSAAFSESMNSLADGLFDEIVGVISRSRGLSENRVRQLVDEAPLSPALALREGLADGLAYRGDIEDRVRERFGDDAHLVSAEVFRQAIEPREAPHLVAVVHVVGLIVEGEGEDLPLLGPCVGADEVVRALQEAERRTDIDGVLLRIDSPGGVLAAAETIWHQVARTSRVKSVVASFGDAAASGAYYLACGAHEIVAQPGTLTGGIGVFGGKIVLSKLLRERGVRIKSFGRGRHASFLDPYEHYGLEQRSVLERRMDEDYKRFVRRVAEARGSTFEDIDRVARGRLWTGRQALERGLVDDLGGMGTALTRLRRLLDVSEDDDLDVECLPKRADLWETVISKRGPALLDRLTGGESRIIEREIHAWTRAAGFLDGRSSLALMPVWLDVR